MPVDPRLRNLAFAHVIAGIVAGVLAPVKLPGPLWLASLIPPFGLQKVLIVPLFSLTMAQAVLLALWAVSSASSPWRRLGGLILGTASLGALLVLSLNEGFLGIDVVTVGFTWASLFVLRRMGIGLARGPEHAQPGPAQPDGLRFSIRGLMAFTAAVALLSSGARALPSYHVRFFLITATWALCFATVGLVALWAGLGSSPSRRRATIVFTLSPLLGFFFALAISAHQAGTLYIVLTMLFFPAILLASMLVIRSCGYRLVRRPKLSSETPPGGVHLEASSASESFSVSSSL